MAGVTDAPFRKIARDFGAGMACTKMISSEALVRRHRESLRLMDLDWDQRPVSVQLMGGDPGVMAEAARMAEAAGADIVDINMGCPVPKVVKTSGGSSLLRDPDGASRVAEAVVGAVSVPVTVKIRLGWDFATRNYLEMATRLERTGIQGLAVHGRRRSQRYDPSADWTATAHVQAGAPPGYGRWCSRSRPRRTSPWCSTPRWRSIPARSRSTARSKMPRRPAKPPDGTFSPSRRRSRHEASLDAPARPGPRRLWRSGG